MLVFCLKTQWRWGKNYKAVNLMVYTDGSDVASLGELDGIFYILAGVC